MLCPNVQKRIFFEKANKRKGQLFPNSQRNLIEEENGRVIIEPILFLQIMPKCVLCTSSRQIFCAERSDSNLGRCRGRLKRKNPEGKCCANEDKPATTLMFYDQIACC